MTRSNCCLERRSIVDAGMVALERQGVAKNKQLQLVIDLLAAEGQPKGKSCRR
jgi:hypothetical protein